MKVLNYLEYDKLYKRRLSNKDDYDYCDKFGSHVQDRNINEFYSQIFVPELITKLFEGFSDVFDYESPVEFNLIDTIYTIYFFNENNDMNISKNDITNSETNAPNTLNDFITLCKLAGIELKWRVKCFK